MQNEDTRKFLKELSSYGYEKVRQDGSSHAIYERVVVLKDTVSVPVGSKTINGGLIYGTRKQIKSFDEKVKNVKCKFQEVIT